MTEPNPPIMFDDCSEVQILFQATDDFSRGFLVILGDGGRCLEIPVTREDCVRLVEAMLEFVAPGHQLRAAMPAGRA
jgi:hypothetical protein